MPAGRTPTEIGQRTSRKAGKRTLRRASRRAARRLTPTILDTTDAPTISAFLDPSPLIRQRVARANPLAPVSETLELRRTQAEDQALRAGSMLEGRVRSAGGPSTLDALSIASLGFPAAGLGGLAARGLAKAGAAALGKDVASAAGKRVVGAAAARAAATSASTVARTAPRAARAANPARLARDAAQAVGKTKGVQGAARVARSRPVRAAGRGARVVGRAATFPIRRPIKTTKYSVMAQAPIALAEQDASRLADPFMGEGVVADVLGPVSEAVSSLAPGDVAENFAKDVIDLPANLPPSLYMPLAGVKEAVFDDDSSRLEGLWEDYKEHGLLPNLVTGDFAGAAEAAKEHPLFAILEARGVQAGVGRSAGAAMRAGVAGERGKQIASQERKPLRVRGTGIQRDRSYSPDVIEKAFQMRGDVKRAEREGGQYASTSGLVRGREANNIVNEYVDTLVAGSEGARRFNRQTQTDEAAAVMPGRKVDQDGVAFAMQGIARSRETMAYDLASYGKQLDRKAKRLRQKISKEPDRAKKALLRERLKANRATAKQALSVLKDGDPDAIFASAADNAAAIRKLDLGLEAGGLLGEGQGVRAAAVPFAIQHMGASRGVPARNQAEAAQLREQAANAATDAEAGALMSQAAKLESEQRILDAEGNPLPLDRIHGEMRNQGVNPDEVGFLTQRPGARGPGSFFRAMWPGRQTLPKSARSGKATKEGAFDATYEAILEQRVRAQGIVDAVKGFDTVVRELAADLPRFASFTDPAIRGHQIAAERRGVKLVPVRLAPFSARSGEARKAEEIFDSLDPNNQMGRRKVAEDLASEALRDGPGPVVLMPEQAAKRLKEHYTAATTTRKAAQLISSSFKGTVLPTSPNWFLGNFTDVTMRSLASGTIPWGRDAALGRRIMRDVEKLDPETAARVKAELVPGTVHGQAAGSRVHRDARQFVDTKLAPFAAAFGVLRRTPGPKQVVDLYRRYRDGAFAFNERFIERQAQYAQLGKAARREVREKTGQWHKALKLGDDAVADLSRGLLKTENQIKYARQIESVLGRWNRHGPEMRAFLVDYMPFATWARNAATFAFLTLPAKHPIKTAIGAALFEMTEEERDKLGLSHFAEPGTRLPGNLQGSIPLGNGGLITPQSLTTFGFTADLQTSLSGMVLPQFPLQELAGLDFTGEKLVDSEGRPLDELGQAKAAFMATAEAYIPFLAMGTRIEENGAYEGIAPRSVRPYDAQLAGYLRSLSGKTNIQVPVRGSSFEPTVPDSGSSSSGSSSSGSSDSGISTPWRDSGSSDSGVSTPWRD